MSTERYLPATPESIARAAQLMADGGVVAFPTDTVYGLACDLFNAAAVRRIFEIKGRPHRMPLIAMIADLAQWALVAESVPSGARILSERWWPGPLTIIVPAHAGIPAEVLGGGNTIGVRIPDHPVALELLRQAGRPLATTSANRSGDPAACTADDVTAALGDAVDLILDAGPSPQGVPSTVVDCTVTPPRILREGHLNASMLGLVR
jgi:L-threonylcarbamoyladenylate synthase